MANPRLFTARQAVVAFVISPLVAPALFVAVGLARGAQLSMLNIAIYCLAIALHAYVAALLIGLPAYLLRPVSPGTLYFVVGGPSRGS